MAYAPDVSRFAVRVTPRAARDRIDGFDVDGVLRLRVAALPADGEANAAVVKLLARALGLPLRDVALVSGASGRLKVFEVTLSEAKVRERLRS